MNTEIKQLTNIKKTLKNSQFSDYSFFKFIKNKTSIAEEYLFFNTEFLSHYLINKKEYDRLYVPDLFKGLNLIKKDLKQKEHSCEKINLNNDIGYKFTNMNLFQSIHYKTILYLLVEGSNYSFDHLTKEQLLNKINNNELIYDVNFQSIPIHVNLNLFEKEDRKLLVDILLNLSVYRKHIDIGQAIINKEIETILKKYYNKLTYYVLDPETQLYISFSN